MTEQRNQAVCIAQPKNNTTRNCFCDFDSLVDTGKSLGLNCTYEQNTLPDIEPLMEMARNIAGFKIGQGKVFCPVIVVSESNGFKFEESKLDITFGNQTNRSKMMTSVNIKRDILKKLQDVPNVNEINKDEYKGVMVGLKDIETLILIPLQNTRMRKLELEEAARQQEEESNDNVHKKSDRVMRKRAMRLLIALKDVIHSFDENVIYGFKTNVVIGHSQKITQSQVSVSKLLWRGLFESHKTLMDGVLLAQVFQVRRRPATAGQKRPRATTGGKSPAYLEEQFPAFLEEQVKTARASSSSGKALKQIQTDQTLCAYDDAKTMQRVLLSNFESRNGDIGQATIQYVTRFVEKYLDCVGDETFITNMMEAAQHASPEDPLIEGIPAMLEDPKCSELKTELESINMDFE